MWSLSVEEHFYLLWPFLFIALGRHRMRFVGYAILAVLATRVILLSMRIGVYEQTYARADSLLVGCAAAMMFAYLSPRLGRWVAPATLAAVFVTFAFMPWMTFTMMSFGFTILAIVCAALIVAVLSGETFVNRLLRWAPMQYVGRRSYGLYVYHAPLFIAFQRLGIEGDAWSLAVMSAAAALATFGVAEVSYRTIEAWARGLASRFRAERGGFPSLTPRAGEWRPEHESNVRPAP
jgi:peptidoglycan/LPS O-acetylase OafA/YrhL